MEIELERYQEFRIEVLESQKMKIMVTAGLTEIRGQELLNDKWYTLSNTKTSIFTFTGAKLKIDGNCDLHYKTHQQCFLQTFEYFDGNRDTPKTVLVLGKGRSTFCATVANYFARMHKKIDFVELDPSRGNIFPLCLSFLQVDGFVDWQEGFKLSNPVVYFYGSLTVENTELFDLQTSRLSDSLKTLGKETDDNLKEPSNSSFRLILCPELSADEINSLAGKFMASEIVVIGDERLFHRMNFKVPKVFIQNNGYIAENTVSRSIYRYFNGTNNEYTPCSFIVKHDWEIVRIGELFSAPESALPLGSTRKVGKTDICKTELVENSILAVSSAEKEEDVVVSPVICFIVCLDEKKFRVLCTQPKLPKMKYLIQGNLKYIDF